MIILYLSPKSSHLDKREYFLTEIGVEIREQQKEIAEQIASPTAKEEPEQKPHGVVTWKNPMLVVELVISQHNFRTKNPLEYGCDFIDKQLVRHKT